jgi:hypothetical protein
LCNISTSKLIQIERNQSFNQSEVLTFAGPSKPLKAPRKKREDRAIQKFVLNPNSVWNTILPQNLQSSLLALFFLFIFLPDHTIERSLILKEQWFQIQCAPGKFKFKTKIITNHMWELLSTHTEIRPITITGFRP